MKWCGASGILLLIMIVLCGGPIERASAVEALPVGLRACSQHNIRVEGRRITLRGCRTTERIEITGADANEVLVENSQVGRLTIEGVAKISIVNSQITDGLEVGAAELVGCSSSVISGVYYNDVANSRYIGCEIRSNQNDFNVVYLRSEARCNLDTGFVGNHYFERNVIINYDPSEGDRCSAVRFLCSSENTFINNAIYSIDCMGIYMRDNADRHLIKGNFIWKRTRNTGFGAPLEFADGNGDKHEPSYNIITGNVIRSDAGPAIYEAIHSGGNEYSYNEIVSNGASGAWLRVDPSQINPGRSPAAYGPKNIFRNNTFYSDDGPAVSLGTQSNVGWRHATDYEFKNNIVSSTGSRIISYHDGAPIAWPNNSYYSKFKSNFNIFFQGGFAPNFGSVTYATSSGTSTETFGDLAGWRARTGSDVGSNHGQGPSYIADPKFVNAAKGNFQIQSNSAAIGAGEGGATAGAYLLQNPSCPVENWRCSEWSQFVTSDGFKFRSCMDVNECHTRHNRPALTCCADTSKCGSGYSGPMENQACSSLPPTDTIAPAEPSGLRVG